MTLDITRPDTSSMTAALTKTVPTRVCDRFMDFEAPPITAKVVPRLVVDNAAPIIKDSTAPKPYPRYRSRYDSPIGKRTPVVAAIIVREKFCFKRSIRVIRPPSKTMRIKPM